MRLKIHRNVGLNLVNEFRQASLNLPAFAEGQVVECSKDVGEKLIELKLADLSTDAVTKADATKG